MSECVQVGGGGCGVYLRLFVFVCFGMSMLCFVKVCKGVWEGSVCRVSKRRKERTREENEKE